MNNVTQFKDNCLRRFECFGTKADPNADKNRIRMKIRESSRMMFHAMLKVFYDVVYEGKKLPPKGWIQPNPDLSEPEQLRDMFLKFLHENRERWQQSLEQNNLYGRENDSTKDSIKLELLEDVATIFNDGYAHFTGESHEA